MSWNCLPGFYSSTFLQSVNVIKKLNLELSFETQSLQVFSSIFLYCLSRKTLDRFFIFLHHCFYTYKAQILTKQMGLANRFVIPQENLCSCVQKIKNKHDDGADVFVFLFLRVTHSIVDMLTVLLNNKYKNLGNEEAY